MLTVATSEAVCYRHLTKQAILLAVFTILLLTALFSLQSHVGFNIADEGYLWYGAQRILAGEVPIRDFMAYDPGRYYWSAGLMSLLGNNGLVALRFTEVIFQAIGLFLGLFLLSYNRPQRNSIFLLLVAGTLVLWMFTLFKVFDTTVSLILIASFTYLVEQPSKRRYFWTGVVLGLSAVFGRNHGLYGALGGAGLIIYLSFKRSNVSLWVAFTYWLMGITIGYLPSLFMLVVIPGFPTAFWESIRYLFEVKSTNIPLPIPWPWRVSFGQISWLESVRGVVLGCLFISIFLYGVLSLIYVLRARFNQVKVSPLFIATAFTALPYVHYAFSRADLTHLSFGIFPFLIGMFLILIDQSKIIKFSGALFLFGISVLMLLPMFSFWQLIQNKNFVETQIGNDQIKVDPGTAGNLNMLRILANTYSPNGRLFLCTPSCPGAYPMLGRKSPDWEIYALLPRSLAFQQTEIERIKRANPGFILVSDAPLDGNDAWRFSHTHPLINQYIRNNFIALKNVVPSDVYQIYKKKP